MKIAVYPGSFDPVTNGHLDIITRASGLVDKLIVAVAENPVKNPLFTVKERLDMLSKTVRGNKKIKIDTFKGLLVDFANKNKAGIIIKGLRAVSDFEFEYQMALLNKQLDADVETMFLMTSNQYAFLSSSSVKEISALGGRVSGLVPAYVEKKIKEKYRLPDFAKAKQKIEID